MYMCVISNIEKDSSDNELESSFLNSFYHYDFFKSPWKSSQYCQSILLKYTRRQVRTDPPDFAQKNSWLWDRNWVSYLKWQSDFRFPLRRLHWLAESSQFISSSPHIRGNVSVSETQLKVGYSIFKRYWYLILSDLVYFLFVHKYLLCTVCGVW